MKRFTNSLVAAGLVLLTACGPDVTAWKGAWKGSAAVNTGRAPEIVTGTLTIADGARFTVTSDPHGSPAQVYSCALNASSADATTVTFATPATCQLSVTPGDGCSYAITVNAASATRAGDSLTAQVTGRSSSTCAGGGNTVTDFALDLAAKR